MKKSLNFLFALICTLGLFTSCEKGESTPPIETNIVGTYKGTLDVIIGKQPAASGTPQKVYISKSGAGENQIKLEIKAFTFGTMNLGDIKVDPCIVTLQNGTYHFAGKQTISLTPPIGDCPISVKGTIDKVGKMNIEIKVTVAALGQDVTATFDGTKLNGSESKEAKITAFTIESPVITEQPTIDETNGKITFKVSDAATIDDLKTLVPTVTISDKATVEPRSGVAQDFSAGRKITYTVVAQDGTIKTYEASIAGNQNVLKYSFEEWENVPLNPISNEYDKPQPVDELATSAEGAGMLKLFGVTEMPVYKSDDKKNGNYAIKLYTMNTVAQANALVPAITAGSVFMGKFDMDFLGDGKLYCTRFGIPYAKKPLRFKGWYKYSPGADFIDGSDVENIDTLPGQIDQCAIKAVLFQIDADDEVLTGFDIATSPKLVAVAALADGTAKAQYTQFDLPFIFLDGKTYDTSAKYKMAIVCSSSKDGDTFKGAGGSTLILDDLEIIGE